ncbi:MAG: hypothetical protein U1A05_01725, partial [Alphaproteobacteria bacterium]|nr:hypothetical protein [Alphaproteobacteria bacterium]
QIITLTPYSWFLSPLISSLSRSIISGEKFDGTFLSRLTGTRCLKIALVLWIMGFAFVPFEFFLNPELMPTLLGIPAVILVFLVLYILYRLYYLLPIFALDRQFSTVYQAWLATKGKTWSMFKVHFLILFLFGMSMDLLGFLIQNLGLVLSHTGQVITFEILSTAVFALVVEPVFVGGIAVTYMILEQKKK